MGKRKFLFGLVWLAMMAPAERAFADDGGDSEGGQSSGGEDSGGDDGGGGEQEQQEKDDGGHQGAISAVNRGEIAPLPVIFKIALKHTPGQVIAVNLNHQGSSYIYRLKILTAHGRKREVYVDARSRKIVRVN